MPGSTKAALVIFARHPSGRVKTRLVPPLTPAQARGLHRACLESTVRLAASLPRAVDKFLYLTPASRRALQGERVLRLPRALRRRRQRGRDLGARLEAALRELLGGGYRRVVFIGADSPTLPLPQLRQAFAALEQGGAVIGPARDGGYYLIGLRTRPGEAPPIFRGITWGTARAFQQTRARLRRARRKTVLLPLWYDVDVPADLERLRGDVARSRAAHLAPLRAWLGRQKKD